MVLEGKTEGKSQLGKVSVDGKIKLKTNLQEIEWDYGLD
jgi:hypothetical protein